MTETSRRDATDSATSVRVADHLRAAILDGTIKPGEWIRQEDVADRLGASRLPVREALRMLEAEGLTVHVRNKGARVPRLSQHEVDVIYQMRERLEPLALSESIPHLSDDDIRAIDETQRRIEENDDLGRFLALDREFHLLSYTGCPISQLMGIVTRLWNSTQHYRRAFVSMGGPERMWVVHAEHRLILDALERRDALDAERYLSGHIRRTRVALAQHPEIFAEPS
jgi:DNA-binding GntR family transcriptional regulator